jgi:hypothetical protein
VRGKSDLLNLERQKLINTTIAKVVHIFTWLTAQKPFHTFVCSLELMKQVSGLIARAVHLPDPDKESGEESRWKERSRDTHRIDVSMAGCHVPKGLFIMLTFAPLQYSTIIIVICYSSLRRSPIISSLVPRSLQTPISFPNRPTSVSWTLV